MRALMILLAVGCLPATALAQDQQKSLASTLDVYVFPDQGQDASQQSKDESECYNWAVQNTGSDPFEVQKQAEQDMQTAAAQAESAQQVGRGSGARGAVGGAAAGALIGEIANDDSSEGAAWGAALGAIHGRRRGRQAQAQAQTDVAVGAMSQSAASAEQIDNFKKAFSVCLESHDYMVKY